MRNAEDFQVFRFCVWLGTRYIRARIDIPNEDPAMSLRFDGKVAVVTGGSMGIGAATARLLCKLGASVAVLDLNARVGKETVAELTGGGQNAIFVSCDVTRESDVQAGIDAAVRKFGALDILISNAGIQTYGNVVNTLTRDWDETFDVHVKGCFFLTKHAIPHIRESGGSVVIVASVQSYAAVANSISYVTAKHALLGMTRALALDYARKNIRVNCVCPGSVDTPMLRGGVDLMELEEETASNLGRAHALGRIGRADEIAKAIAFLASDWASFVTGTSLVADGGLLVPAGGMAFQEPFLSGHQGDVALSRDIS